MQKRVTDYLFSNSADCRACNVSPARILIFWRGEKTPSELSGFLFNFFPACFRLSLQQPAAAASGLAANSFGLDLKVPTEEISRKQVCNMNLILLGVLVVVVALRNVEGKYGCDSALVKAVDCKDR